ncbi:CPCC family cysteine-rich protein [Singulisphaera sp. Ch08]|uniref:CPCC family cysteine-rich protein n=1 Tax=Singulisphaera sp. Ch08 TaxID=3120278 RepID=A0AAU7C6U5_9BACT
MKYKCFICGYYTLDYRCEWKICEICFWEDDVFVDHRNDKSSPANKGMMVSRAQANFMLFGAMSREFVGVVRKPFASEVRDPEWKPLDSALAIFDQESRGH